MVFAVPFPSRMMGIVINTSVAQPAKSQVGRWTVSPEAALLMALWTLAGEQLAALIVAARAGPMSRSPNGRRKRSRRYIPSLLRFLKREDDHEAGRAGRRGTPVAAHPLIGRQGGIRRINRDGDCRRARIIFILVNRQIGGEQIAIRPRTLVTPRHRRT